MRGASSRWGVGAGASPLAVEFFPITSCLCRATYSKRFCRRCMKAHTAVRTAMTSAAEKMRLSLALDAVSYPAVAYPALEESVSSLWLSVQAHALLTHLP